MTVLELKNLVSEAIYIALRNVLERSFYKLGLWMIAFFIISVIYNSSPIGRDSTDGEERSGLKIHVDNLTGCQYLSVSGGGLYKRLSAEGYHIGCSI